MTTQRRLAFGFVGGVLVLVLLRTFVLGIYTVPTFSMAPTLLRGDWIVVDRLTLGSAGPKRGDVIVFRGGGEEHVKRVIGLPGESVEIRSGRLLINGNPLSSTPLKEVVPDADGAIPAQARGLTSHVLNEEVSDGRTWRTLEFRGEAATSGTYAVPPGHLFVLGDNRGGSVDSRQASVGFVPLAAVEGRVTYVVRSQAGAANYRWFHRIE